MSALKTVRKFACSILVLVALLLTCAVFCPSPLGAEEAADRKVKYRVEPQYPEIARKIGLSGVVKIEVVIAPDGSVKDTKVIGGHPILVNAAVGAVKKWKFESASGQSIKSLEFRFQPDQP